MQYRSTRGKMKESLNSAQAVIKGLAPDGGLYVPVNFTQVKLPLTKLSQMTYQEIAEMVLGWFFDDFTHDQLYKVVNDAYGSQWDQQQIAPLSVAHDGNYYLELFHGPTLAFKDIALQVLPRLMTQAIKNEHNDHQIVILTATSGDTGTASMRGFRDLSGTQVIVFYPHGGVSPVQLKQMLGQRGTNLSAIAIEGNFDDAQTAVKNIFNDLSFNQRLLDNHYQFSSANSMNIGRLIPQIVYYFSAYGQLVHRQAIKPGDPVNFTVPTGNFGDILAGYYAKKLGLPIHKLICASNENNVLTDFFTSGQYNRKRPFHLTNAPAMDILVSSNLERLLFDVANENESTIQVLMQQLSEDGSYSVSSDIKAKLDQTFAAGFATQDEVRSEIKRIYTDDGYLIDPHTAVASYVAHQYRQKQHDSTPNVIVSTASPYKFPETAIYALNDQKTAVTGIPAIKELQSIIDQPLDSNVQTLLKMTAREERVINPSSMEKTIAKILEI